MPEVVCSRCSHPNSSQSNFCSSCGFDLAARVTESTEAHLLDLSTETVEFDPNEPGPEGAVFVVKRGSKAGSRFALDTAVVTVGRHPDSEIFLDDITVSRRHAEVRLEEGAYMVSDVGSLNGTYLNRERIEQARLTSGDELQVGKFKLVFLTGDTQ